MVAFYLLLPYGRILGAILSFLTIIQFSRTKKLVFFNIGFMLLLYNLATVIFPLDSYLLLFIAGLLLVPDKKNTLLIYRLWAITSLIELFVSFILLGSFDFYGNYFDLHSMQLSQSVTDSNLAGLLLLGLFLVESNRREKFILFVIISLVGFATGSRTFLAAMGLFIILIIIRNGAKVYLPFFLLIFLFADFTSILPERGIESSRFLAWQMALNDYGLFGLNRLVTTEKYYVSAFHNGILDAYYLYGPYLGTLIQIFFIAFILIFFDWSIATVSILLYCILVYLTSVVWRGDIVFFLIAYNILSSDIRFFKFR